MKYVMFSALSVMLLVGCGGGSSGSTDGGDDTDQADSGGQEVQSGSNGQGGSDEQGAPGVVEAVTGLSGTFRYLGFVEIIQDNFLARVNRDINFLELTSPQDAAVFNDSVPMVVDTCKLYIDDSIRADASVIGFPDTTFNFVSAGESLTLTGDFGTYATIDVTESRFEFAPHPVPVPLTVDIPGDEFPAFANIAIPDIVRVQNFEPFRSGVLEADTVISWTPTGIANHTINLIAVDFPADQTVVDLRCHVADDGEFVLPENIVATLSASLGSDFAIENLEQNMRSDLLVVQGDALLVVSKSLL